MTAILQVQSVENPFYIIIIAIFLPNNMDLTASYLKDCLKLGSKDLKNINNNETAGAVF